jgi:hypothetical protein
MIWRAKLRAALRQSKYEAVVRALEKLAAELHNINPSAEASLKEGLEETLSLHKLGLYAELGKNLSSTNCIESVMSQLGQYTDKVDRWRGGNHIQRWAASGLLALEPRLQKMRGFRYLKLLRAQLQQEVAKRQEKQVLGSPTLNDLGAGIQLLPLKIEGEMMRREFPISTKICIDSGKDLSHCSICCFILSLTCRVFSIFSSCVP